jgi:catechol 2,3-dioxygenase-like lactoylglutathione lyase family enzyme
LLGLRLVKLTVNFDDPGTYHLLFRQRCRDARLDAAHVLPVGKISERASSVRAGVTATTFAIPAGSVAYWRRRLTERGITERRRRAF